jgi:hypothetical protein
LRLPFLPDLARLLFKVLTDPDRGGCGEDRSQLVLDPDLNEMTAAVNDAVSAADADRATLILAFLGHAEAVRDRLYLPPRDGTSPSTMDSGFLLGTRVTEPSTNSKTPSPAASRDAGQRRTGRLARAFAHGGQPT